MVETNDNHPAPHCAEWQMTDFKLQSDGCRRPPVVAGGGR